MKTKLPIFSTSDGRTVMGYAGSVKQATATIKSLISIPTGFILHVWIRDKTMQFILDQPEGFCYVVAKGLK